MPQIKKLFFSILNTK